jgi:hypothetical protein
MTQVPPNVVVATHDRLVLLSATITGIGVASRTRALISLYPSPFLPFVWPKP